MTRTLVLIRHAKSSWDDPNQSDHDRPLNRRGRNAAPKIGAWLAAQGITPDEALVSSAVRTQETWALIAPTLESAPDRVSDRRLYLAHPSEMMARLQKATGACVVMVAHNPGTASLARALVVAPPPHPGFGHYPTAATSIIDFPIDHWAALEPGTGQVRAFIVPRDLDV